MEPVSVKNMKVDDVMSNEYVSICEDDSLGDALGKMKETNIYELMVLKSGSKDIISGVLTYDVVMMRKKLSMETKVGNIMSPAPKISEVDSIVDVSEKLLAVESKTLPVTKKDRIVGVVSRRDIILAAAASMEIGGVDVQEIMTPEPRTVLETDKMLKAMHIMRELDEHFVPVVSKDEKVIGVVGSREMVSLHTPSKRETRGDRSGDSKPPEIMVSSIMIPPVTIGPGLSVANAVDVMHKKNVPSVLIEEDGKLLGVLTESDVVELVLSTRDQEGVFVQISGLDHVDPDVYDGIYEMVGKYMRKVANFYQPQTLMIHSSQHNTTGGEAKYSVHMRLNTNKRMFFTKSSEWDIYIAVDKALEDMEKIARREKDKLKKSTRMLR